jgi:hypothetical protein
MKKLIESWKKYLTEEFSPHMMYDPKTGKGYKADKKEDHERMKKLGYDHEKPEEEPNIEEGKICDKGIGYVTRTDPGGKDIKKGKDGKLKNWSARAAQIASKYCKDPNYGKGRGKDAKDEGSLGDWESENWTHSDGTACGDGKKDGSDSRCKPASKWKGMSKGEKAADNAKKKAGTKAGKQYVSATKKGKVTKSYTKESTDLENDTVEEKCQKGYKTHPTQKTKELYDKTYRNCIKAEHVDLVVNAIVNEMQGYHEVDALSEDEEYCPSCAPLHQEAKPAKGKRFAKKVKGKGGRTRTVSYGQAGEKKGGGDRISPGTKKADAYCARSNKIKKCKNPPCANTLSRKKWKCQGDRSVAE